MNVFYQDLAFTFQLLRHLALAFFLLGLLYGFQVHRQTRWAGPATVPLVLVALLIVWHGLLFLWTLFLWGPAPLGIALHHLINLPLPVLLLTFWWLAPEDRRWRLVLIGLVVGLAALLPIALLLALEWLPPTTALRTLYGLMALGVAAGGYALRRHTPYRGRYFAWGALALVVLAGGLEALTGSTPARLNLWMGAVELVLAPLLLVWPYLWPARTPRPRPTAPAPSPPTVLAPYLEHLDNLLQTAQQGPTWNPVPFMIQAVLTHIDQRLQPSVEPRAHIPLPRLMERVLERHQPTMARRRLRLTLQLDPYLSLDPSLGEWFLELALHYLEHQAQPYSSAVLRLQGSQDPQHGAVAYAVLEHHVAEAQHRGEPEPWFAPALLLARLLVLDLGGDWWFEDEGARRTLWLRLPLGGFGRLLRPNAAPSPNPAEDASAS